MKTLKDLALEGKRVLVRVDFNVPLKPQEDGSIAVGDDTRIRAALPTIRFLLERKARVLLMSHLGRPKGGPDPKFSLAPVATYLGTLVNTPVHFCPETVGAVAESASNSLANGEILVLENTRFLAGETKNNEEISKGLASLTDIYVNDAFGSAHRAHASTEGITRFVGEKAVGFLMQKEVEALRTLIESPTSPFVAVVGGAKVSDKIGVIESLLQRADLLLIGGAMSYTFLAAQGLPIGSSKYEADKVDLARDLLARAGDRILLPGDHVVAATFSNDAETHVVSVIPEGMMALDIGPATRERYRDALLHAKTIVWNGPMGVFELPTFAHGTLTIAQALADSTEKGAMSVVGGGDSVAAITQMKFEDRVSHVSTGGGAMLEYLEGITLPGVAALD